jgi:hypothetical protein
MLFQVVEAMSVSHSNFIVCSSSSLRKMITTDEAIQLCMF